MQVLAARGEPLLSGFEPGVPAMQDFFRPFGWDLVELLGPRCAHQPVTYTYPKIGHEYIKPWPPYNMTLGPHDLTAAACSSGHHSAKYFENATSSAN